MYDTERKDIEIKGTIWGKLTAGRVTLPRENAHRNDPRAWGPQPPQEAGGGKRKLSEKPGKAKSLRCLTGHGKVGAGRFAPGWELPELAADTPEEALPFHPLSKPRNVSDQVPCAALNQVLVTLRYLQSSTKETPFPPGLKTSKTPRINSVPREFLDFEILINRQTYGGTQ